MTTHDDDPGFTERTRALADLLAHCMKCSEIAGAQATLGVVSFAFEDLRAGRPLPEFVDLAREADFWARLAAPVELEAYLVAITRHLPETPLHIKARKRLAASIFRAMPRDDQRAFMAWAKDKVKE